MKGSKSLSSCQLQAPGLELLSFWLLEEDPEAWLSVNNWSKTTSPGAIRAFTVETTGEKIEWQWIGRLQLLEELRVLPCQPGQTEAEEVSPSRTPLGLRGQGSPLVRNPGALSSHLSCGKTHYQHSHASFPNASWAPEDTFPYTDWGRPSTWCLCKGALQWGKREPHINIAQDNVFLQKQIKSIKEN